MERSPQSSHTLSVGSLSPNCSGALATEAGAASETEKKDSGAAASGNDGLTKALFSLICSYEKELIASENKLKELLQLQETTTARLAVENGHFQETKNTFNLPLLFDEVKMYTQKLVRLKGEMHNIQEQVTRLKQRALYLQNHQQQKLFLQAEREKYLIARPVWSDESGGSD